MRLCRIKNKFALSSEELVGGYRDLMLCVVFEVTDKFFNKNSNALNYSFHHCTNLKSYVVESLLIYFQFSNTDCCQLKLLRF